MRVAEGHTVDSTATSAAGRNLGTMLRLTPGQRPRRRLDGLQCLGGLPWERGFHTTTANFARQKKLPGIEVIGPSDTKAGSHWWPIEVIGASGEMLGRECRW